jgi:proteasome accessory factor B
VTEGELVALLVAQKAIEQYRGTTYERTLSQAFAKLTDGLRDVITFDPAVMSDRVSFLSVGTSEPDIEIFRQLSHATIAQREVEFTYRKPGETAAVSRRVRPHHLACVRNLWYLIAWDCERHAMRTFALPRIAELKVTRQQFARENDFSPEAHFRDGFGIYSGGGSTQTVVLEFDAHAAALIQERSWHASQKFEPLPNGGVRLTLLLSRFEDLEGWILGWGRHVRVVAPSDLAEHIRGELHDAILGYDPNAKISRRHL